MRRLLIAALLLLGLFSLTGCHRFWHGHGHHHGHSHGHHSHSHHKTVIHCAH